MAPEDEVLVFTRSLFRGRPDLSTLTLSTVRRKFLAHTGRDRLRPEEKQALKRLVEEELLNMQVEDAGSREEKLGFAKVKRPPAPRGDPGRKRFRFDSESESTSAPSSPDCLGPPAKDETAEEESPRRALKKAAGSIAEQQRDLVAKMGSEESSEEEGEEPVRTIKVLKEESREEETDRQGSVSGESDRERESDCEAGANPNRGPKNPSSKKGSKKSRPRSCSSSSDGSPESKKAGSHRRGEDHPAVVRLKRYIRACGAHRNYKKLLGSCRSHKERLSVLRSELEALGMKGNPSLEKCRALKERREEAAEMASLDVANIISSSGRPRRRTAWNPSGETVPPRELYHRTLDSDDEQPRQAPPDWSHMRGIISSDGESN